MATRRGPKVQPHKNPRVENEANANDAPESLKTDIFEEVTETKNKWEESGILNDLTGNIDPKAGELFESETSHVIDEASEPVDFTGEDLIAEDEFITSEPAKTPHFEFQDEYHFGPGNGDAVIDALPQEEQRLPSPEVLAEVDEYMNAPKGPEHYSHEKSAEVEKPKVTAPRVKKTFAQMTACEMNIYKKTGIIPFA